MDIAAAEMSSRAELEGAESHGVQPSVHAGRLLREPWKRWSWRAALDSERMVGVLTVDVNATHHADSAWCHAHRVLAWVAAVGAQRLLAYPRAQAS